MMKRIQIITGHYGSGKTEYAVNLALALAQEKEHVALADMDIVNPYFRSYEQAKRLEDAGIRVIVTSCGGIADIPAINPEVMSIFQQEQWTGVLDIGGDPIGARVLARFAHMIREGEYDLLFVLNATSLQLIPTSIVAVRVAMHSASPNDIVIPTLLATLLSTVIGVTLTRVFIRPKVTSPTPLKAAKLQKMQGAGI